MGRYIGVFTLVVSISALNIFLAEPVFAATDPSVSTAEGGECELGCDGICNSGKQLDQCGVCGGFGPGECGCDPSLIRDACGVCGGPGPGECGCDRSLVRKVCGCNDDYSCLDCNGVPYGPNANCGCALYQVEVDYLGHWGLADPIFVRTVNTMSCIDAEIQRAYNACRGIASRWGMRWLDDCIVGGYFLGDPSLLALNRYPHGPWQPVNRRSPVRELGFNFYTEGTFYLDQNCNPVRNPSQDQLSRVCDAGTFRWRGSPISLVWEAGYDLDRELSVVTFPLELGTEKRWYAWKASDKAPLLVYDPKHTGKITSATQLFGEWALGGQKLVSLNGALSGVGPKWKHGFEALATLDQDRNGKVDGLELSPLALWFDKNRDGVSDTGEVIPVTELDVVSLYYNPDRIDAKSGNVYVDRGFERNVSGKLTYGAAVDWFVEGDNSKFELVNKYVSQGLSCDNADSSANILLPTDVNEQPLLKDSSKVEPETLNGIWVWETNDSNVPEIYGPKGYLLLNDLGHGKIGGHSLFELSLRSDFKGANSTVKIYALTGKKLGNGIDFEFLAEGSGTVRSSAELTADGRLKGKTTVTIERNGKPATVEYNWQAVKKFQDSDVMGVSFTP